MGSDRSSVTPEEKAAIIAGVSQVMLDVLNKPLESTYVVIEEVEPDNWGPGGLPTAHLQEEKGRRESLKACFMPGNFFRDAAGSNRRHLLFRSVWRTNSPQHDGQALRIAATIELCSSCSSQEQEHGSVDRDGGAKVHE
ncbi:4-oxalocrotonate tautomerase family enzyme [Pararhizobium capsulatum DSM 1112]|uniref:4-oxalocrotonate tautomerase family enzyme n=1 Tax=Pararhizobium capsulatum DSM 1112 TaxID=1121113 RepID=A0ABU0C492_9HYPH|nr:4-oxalocrotonate tautomerase family enzyme [Pararhizobium capsulatum DSM 1112]